MSVVTANDVLQRAAARLSEAGVSDPRDDAETLLRHLLGWDRAGLLARSADPLNDEVADRLFALVEERSRRRPLQHLTGVQAFWRHEFLVGPDVLIPRPETELIVEAAVERLRAASSPVLVDVGTGSGCIALSVAAELPGARVYATDVSPAALSVARQNASRLGSEGRVSFHEGDLLAPVREFAPFDLVASNPPYVDPAEIAGLSPEVRDHEPRLALVPPGDDACGIYRRLVPEAYAVLKPAGVLLLEIGQGMAKSVTAICSGAGLVVEDVLLDLQRIPRTVVARRD